MSKFYISNCLNKYRLVRQIEVVDNGTLNDIDRKEIILADFFPSFNYF